MARFLVPQRSRIVRWRGALDGLLPDNHLARFIWQVLTSIDFGDLEATYPSIAGGPGRSPFHPRVLVALWTYAMTQGMEEAATIAEACHLRDDFRWLAGGLCPSDQTMLNLLTRAQDRLLSIWEQLLRAMHEAGHVDLSAVAEDGTKLRANASHASFHSADEITDIVKQLRGELEERMAQATTGPDRPENRRAGAAIAGLRCRLARAERAAAELQEREQRRSSKGSHGASPPPSAAPALSSPDNPPQRFRSADFRRDAERELMICPAQQELHLIGIYPTENGRSRYRLYGRSDCSGCAVKVRCTNAKGRRLKVLIEEVEAPRTPPLNVTAVDPPPTDATVPNDLSAAISKTVPIGRDDRLGPEERARPQVGAQASITEPDALMMLATSEKRWEPSYNADITVTRHGVIVSQFLTKRPTDYHHFEPALAAVCSTLKPPQSWVGDGHYKTHANLVAAAKAGVVFYAGSASAAARSEDAPAPTESTMPTMAPTTFASSPVTDDAKTKVASFRGADFRLDVERDLLVCPAGEELHFLGAYPTENRQRLYRLYARSNCGTCLLKARCTEAKGRRVKIFADPPALPPREQGANSATENAGDAPPDPGSTPTLDVLIREHETRMNDIGPNVMRFRGQTVEPVNGQLKQHGLGRLHVHGLARSSVVLALGCMAHNLMKWKAREAARAMRLAA
ncbi:MAG TPA: transposase [Sphingomicrobium sp.]|nr:transposase [Sphingomicrobium sp.]